MALLHSLIDGLADALPNRLSDRLSEFGEGSGDSLRARGFGTDFLVASADVLHEGEPGDDDGGGVVSA
jgi:hypothetical protein